MLGGRRGRMRSSFRSQATAFYAMANPPLMLRLPRRVGRWMLLVPTAVAGALLATAPRAEIYRCIEDGKVVYADYPCGSGAAKVDVGPAPPATSTETQKLEQEASLGHVVIGMTPRQVERVAVDHRHRVAQVGGGMVADPQERAGRLHRI